jgi:hypothetical protein
MFVCTAVVTDSHWIERVCGVHTGLHRGFIPSSVEFVECMALYNPLFSLLLRDVWDCIPKFNFFCSVDKWHNHHHDDDLCNLSREEKSHDVLNIDKGDVLCRWH